MKALIANLAQGFHDTTMVLSLALWLCALPIVLLLTVPFFGWQVGIGAAIITLLAALVACWGICFFPKIPNEENANVTGSRLR